MPIYTGDYLRDTQHLSCSEHGIYLKLLMHCWDQKGPAPLDERKLSGIVNARSSDEVEAMRRVLGEFFIRMEDGHYNKRMQQEVERSEAISGARSAAGRRGYEAKAKHLLSKSQASAEQVPLSPSPSPSLTPSPPPEENPIPVSPRARPTRTAPKSFVLTEDHRAWAKQNTPDVDVDAELDKMRDYTFSSARSDWSATLRNWLRRAQDDMRVNPRRSAKPADVEPAWRKAQRERTEAFIGKPSAKQPINMGEIFDVTATKLG